MNLSRFFQNKVVVITGSARGIGRETARAALGAGALVVVNGRDPVTVELTREGLGYPGRTLGICADVSTPEGAFRLVAQTLEAWGRIDVVINNAGLSMRGAFGDLETGTIRTMVNANFISAVLTTKEALPSLRLSKGTVVFVSSLAGVRGFPGVSLYSASKMALAALHQSLRAEERSRSVTSCLVHLAFTENDPEKTVLGADGKPFRHERKWSTTQGQAAHVILNAAAEGRNRTILSLPGKILVLAQAWVPGLVDFFLDRSGGKIHSVRPKPGP